MSRGSKTYDVSVTRLDNRTLSVTLTPRAPSADDGERTADSVENEINQVVREAVRPYLATMSNGRIDVTVKSDPSS
jgi:hypothetical protein